MFVYGGGVRHLRMQACCIQLWHVSGRLVCRVIPSDLLLGVQDAMSLREQLWSWGHSNFVTDAGWLLAVKRLLAVDRVTPARR
jgi:hypothetical protein